MKTVCVILLAGLLVRPLAAATHTWTGGGSDNLWSTAANWQGNAAPAVGESAPVVLVFPDLIEVIGSGLHVTTDDLPGQLAVDQIKFTAVAPISHTHYTLGAIAGSSIRLTGSAIGWLDASGSGGQTVDDSLAMQLVGTVTFEVDAGTDTLNAPLSGLGALLKSGAGTLRELGSAVNSYAAGTFANDGTLALGRTVGLGAPGAVSISGHLQLLADNQLSDSAAIAVGGAGFLELNGFSDTVGPLTLGHDANGSAQVSTGAGTLTANGDIKLTGTAVAAASLSGNVDLGGGERVIQDFTSGVNVHLICGAKLSNGALTIQGNGGTIVLNGGSANTYLGQTTISHAIVEAGKSSGAAIPANVSLQSASTLRLTASNQIADAAVVTLSSDSQWDLNGFSETITELHLSSDTSQGSQVQSAAGVLTFTAAGSIVLTTTAAGVTPALLSGNVHFVTRVTMNVDRGSGAVALVLAANTTGLGIDKTGDGVVSITGSNTFSQASRITRGTLAVDGTLSAVLLDGGTLAGTGSVGSISVAAGGTLAPGGLLQPGTLHASNVALNASTRALFRLQGATPGTGYDQLVIGGSLQLNGADLQLTAAFTPSGGQAFQLIDKTTAGAISGIFTGHPQPSRMTVGGALLDVRYDAGNGNDFALAESSVQFYTILPCRVVDTRTSTGPIASGGILVFGVTGHCSIPANALAVAINATAVDAAAAGNLVLFAGDQPAPGTNSLNFAATKARANNAVVSLALDSSGTMAAKATLPAGGVQLIVDAVGYFAP